jgi:hypothetical protein
MNILALMLCAMLAGAAPLALLFVPLLLPAKPVEPEPEPPSQEWLDNQAAHVQHMADCAEFGWQW